MNLQERGCGLGVSGSCGIQEPEWFNGIALGHSLPSSAKVKECVELYLHFPITSSWHVADLKKQRENFTFTL
jgi:hypothetical protein